MHGDDGSCYQLNEAQVEELRLEELRQVIRMQKAMGEPLGQPIQSTLNYKHTKGGLEFQLAVASFK